MRQRIQPKRLTIAMNCNALEFQFGHSIVVISPVFRLFMGIRAFAITRTILLFMLALCLICFRSSLGIKGGWELAGEYNRHSEFLQIYTNRTLATFWTG